VSINDIEKVQAMADPAERARRATELMDEHQSAVVELARIRRSAIQELRGMGFTYTKVADALGVSRGRVSQIRMSARTLEHEFFGSGPVTIATPLRTSDQARPLVAEEDSAAVTKLANFLSAAEIETEMDHVDTAGKIDLVPQELVAICGPKSSDVVEGIIRADPYLDFSSNDAGVWRIVDRSSQEEFFSGSNLDPRLDVDVGYLGRVARPDGRPMIVIAGVSALGSLGVVHWLTDTENFTDLHRSTQNRLFSVVISCEASTSPLKVVSTQAVTPIRTFTS
jgi:hypothetical protein